MHWVAATCLADYIFALTSSGTSVPHEVAGECKYPCSDCLTTAKKLFPKVKQKGVRVAKIS